MRKKVKKANNFKNMRNQMCFQKNLGEGGRSNKNVKIRLRCLVRYKCEFTSR